MGPHASTTSGTLSYLHNPDLHSSWPTIPQVYINGEFVGGCDIMLNMHQSGELESLLLKEGLVLPEPEENPRA